MRELFVHPSSVFLILFSLFGWFVVGVVEKLLPVVAVVLCFVVCLTQYLRLCPQIESVPILNQAVDQ